MNCIVRYRNLIPKEHNIAAEASHVVYVYQGWIQKHESHYDSKFHFSCEILDKVLDTVFNRIIIIIIIIITI